MTEETLAEQFFQAIMRGQSGHVRSMVKHNPDLLQARDASGLSGVLLACYYHEPEVAAMLVDLGAPLDLYEAAAVGVVERVLEILEAQPDLLDSFSPDGFQAVHLAAFFGHARVVELLTGQGAQVNTYSRNGFGVMPLHSAVAGKHLEASRILLEHGANPNAIQSEDFTPLMAAAQNGQVEMVALLLHHGADPSVRTRDGRSPADLALEKGFTNLGL